MWEMMKEVGVLGALVACFLIGLFFKDQLGGILAFFSGGAFFVIDVEPALLGRRRGPPHHRRREDEFLGRIGAPVRALRHARHGRRGGARCDGWIKNISATS